MPKLYLEENLGQRDRALRAALYDGFLGRHYRQIMPFLALPVRPAYWGGWLAYWTILMVILALAGYVGYFFAAGRWHPPSPIDISVILLFLGIVCFLLRHKYLMYLLLLAVPVKISLWFTRFKPRETFPEVHERIINKLLETKKQLEVLDISTGSCSSLYRHGWMKLNALYTGLDLSETMLRQGLHFMANKKVPIDLVLGSAGQLPFASDKFDVVLNYGALNGYSDPKGALEEMARVLRRGGLILFLDEQLYTAASFFEKLYFRRVLSSHNTVHRCPIEWMPASVGDVTVHQIYHFYYLCTCYKKGAARSAERRVT